MKVFHLLLALTIICIIIGAVSYALIEGREKPQSWYLKCYYGDKSSTYTVLECDSLQMISTKEAIVWQNGTQTKIYAEKLLPYN